MLLHCPLCISQDAWVSMETAVEQATAVRVPSTPLPPCGRGLVTVLPLPHILGTRPSKGCLFLAFVSSPAVLTGTQLEHVLHAGVQA